MLLIFHNSLQDYFESKTIYQFIYPKRNNFCDVKASHFAIQYNSESKHWLKITQINLIINNIRNEWEILGKAFYQLLVEKEKSKSYGNPISTDSRIKDYTQSLSNTTH